MTDDDTCVVEYHTTDLAAENRALMATLRAVSEAREAVGYRGPVGDTARSVGVDCQFVMRLDAHLPSRHEVTRSVRIQPPAGASD
jgi:hypothetical protein